MENDNQLIISNNIDVGELPRGTPNQSHQVNQVGAGELDALGIAYDPAIHERRKRTNGAWAKKRGNGARKIAGKSFLPPMFSAAQENEQQKPEASGDKPQPAFAAGSHIELPPPSAPNNAPEITPEIETNPEVDYQQTGETLSRGFFGIAQMFLDADPWNASPSEHKVFANAFARVFHHYQLPRLGPLTELLFLIPAAFAKRSEQPKTKRFLDLIKRLLAGTNKYQPEKSQPKAPDAPAPENAKNNSPLSRFRMT